MFCTSNGIFLIGVAKPERMMEGTIKIKAPSKPCCWVTANEEIINPTPTPDNRNKTMPVYSVKRLPSNGTLNQNTAASMITLASARPIRKPGSVFPIRISTGRSGVTNSWSKVPCSRSRAIESAVTSMVTSRVRIPTMAGKKNQRLSRLGLNHARVSMYDGGILPPWFAAHSRLKRLTMMLTSLIASMAVLELRPSTMTCKDAGRPLSKSELKCGPACTTINTCLLSISGAISLSCVIRATLVKLGEPSKAANISREAAPLSSLYTANGTFFKS